jgi:hypothetical protein
MDAAEVGPGNTVCRSRMAHDVKPYGNYTDPLPTGQSFRETVAGGARDQFSIVGHLSSASVIVRSSTEFSGSFRPVLSIVSRP